MNTETLSTAAYWNLLSDRILQIVTISEKTRDCDEKTAIILEMYSNPIKELTRLSCEDIVVEQNEETKEVFLSLFTKDRIFKFQKIANDDMVYYICLDVYLRMSPLMNADKDPNLLVKYFLDELSDEDLGIATNGNQVVIIRINRDNRRLFLDVEQINLDYNIWERFPVRLIIARKDVKLTFRYEHLYYRLISAETVDAKGE